MADIISIKSIEFHIQVKYEVGRDEILQKILFLPINKKHYSYAYDTRFTLNEMLEEFIAKNLLSNKYNNIVFADRTDNIDGIDIRYQFNGEVRWSDIKGFFATIHIYVAPNTGCAYCSRAENKDDFIYCPERNKTLTAPIKRCPVFKQKKDLIIT
mgnify:CR=1 FL=1